MHIIFSLLFLFLAVFYAYRQRILVKEINKHAEAITDLTKVVHTLLSGVEMLARGSKENIPPRIMTSDLNPEDYLTQEEYIAALEEEVLLKLQEEDPEINLTSKSSKKGLLQ